MTRPDLEPHPCRRSMRVSKRAAGDRGRGWPRVSAAARGRQLMEKHADGQREGEIAKRCLLIYVGVWRSFPPRSWKPGKWIEKWKLAHTPTSVVGGVGVTKSKPIGRNRSDLGKLSSSQQTMHWPHTRVHTAAEWMLFTSPHPLFSNNNESFAELNFST